MADADVGFWYRAVMTFDTLRSLTPAVACVATIAVCATVGVCSLVAPDAWTWLYGIEMPTPQARAEVRVHFGGPPLLLAGLLGYLYFVKRAVGEAMWLTLLVVLCFLLPRFVGLAADGLFEQPLTYFEIGLEVGFLLFVLYAMRQQHAAERT